LELQLSYKLAYCDFLSTVLNEELAQVRWSELTQSASSDVVLKAKVLVSRRLKDKQISLGVGLDKKVFRLSRLFASSCY